RAVQDDVESRRAPPGADVARAVLFRGRRTVRDSGGCVMWTMIRKELRGYFSSPIAVPFLAGFLAFALYTFFWREKFFARGLADLRPLFEWMPRLLIVLTSALASRMWADEQRNGTLELLLSLPVPRWRLVLGKFAAGIVFIAIGLVL